MGKQKNRPNNPASGKGTANTNTNTYDFPKFISNLTIPPYFTHTIHTILAGQILTIPKFFTPDQCTQLIQSFSSSLHLETTPNIKRKGYASRVNDRAMLIDTKVAQLLYTYIRQIFLTSGQEEEDILDGLIGLNPNLRIYRYRSDTQQFFEKHYDESVVLDDGNSITKWTLLIYLTGGDDDLIGGDTVFYKDKDKISIHPQVGLAVLHKHGDDCLLHEAIPVIKGTKWVLRSDLVYGLL